MIHLRIERLTSTRGGAEIKSRRVMVSVGPFDRALVADSARLTMGYL